MKNKIAFMIVLIITILLFSTISYGFGIGSLSGTAAQDEVKIFKDTGNNIVKILTTVGIVISVVMLIVLGIRYMMGSVEEKAEYKRTLVPYIIGIGLIFVASVIAQIIYAFARTM